MWKYSKVRVIRNATATARATGFVDGDTVDPVEAGNLLDRLTPPSAAPRVHHR
jgi:hypothetical protein